MSGKNYKKLMKLLKETGHFVEGEGDLPSQDSHSYKTVPFDPITFTKLAIHSWLSGTPRAHFYTNGEEIFYQNGRQRRVELTDEQKADVIREDEILKLFGEAPATPIGIYGEVDGHLRLDNFDYPSKTRHSLNEKSYETYLERISKDIPVGVIRKDEKSQIKKRVKRYSETLAKLLGVLKAEGESLPEYACSLEQRLSRYGYRNGN